MASRIQGITVEIGGDTTKLSKALESVNKSIKGTQSGLKDVNKLLKLDPSNTELVVQKQKMLKDAIEATKEKLATLKTAAQQANEQLANGEITQQQYDALQREIAETEQNLRSLQDQAATTNATLAKIDEAGEKLQNIGSSVENVGKKFLPVTAAVTGLGTAAVKTAADFDSEMSNGLTASDLGTRMYSIDVEEGSVVETYNTLANEIRKRMDDLRKERSMLENEQGELGNMKKNFDFFIDCLKQLPEQNTAGMPLKVYGLNVQSSAYRDEDGNPTSTRKRSLKLTPELIAEAPDLLHFEKGIYCAFIEKGTVKGDVVEFKTTFGVTLTTVGNRRTLNSFRGFKRCNMDGTVEYVDAPYKVYGFSIQYRRYLTMAAKRERKDAV